MTDADHGVHGVHAVIVNFNAGAWLERSVRALLASPELIRLSVFDNASSDDSLSHIETLTGDDRLEIIPSDINLGFGAACNMVLVNSDAPWILVVNPDCVVENGCVKQLRNTLDVRPTGGIAGALIEDADGGEQRACRRRRPTPWRSAISMLGLEWTGAEGVNLTTSLPDEPVELEAVSGALLMIRSTCFREIGGFDGNYFLHCEDLDLFERARAAGWRVWFDPSARASHAKGVSQRHRRVRSEWHKHRSMARYYRTHIAREVFLPFRWLWPVLVWSHFLVLSPVYWLQSRIGS